MSEKHFKIYLFIYLSHAQLDGVVPYTGLQVQHAKHTTLSSVHSSYPQVIPPLPPLHHVAINAYLLDWE